ncbi:MAG: hypothetical protein E7388_01005 [Ruminococcaceae bacterium]|nr:hypothetical protein [Oscillospiraceae bacterium]
MIFFLILSIFIILTGIFSFKESVVTGIVVSVWGILVFIFSILDNYIFTLFFTFFGAGMYFLVSLFVVRDKSKVSVNSLKKEEKPSGNRTIEKKKSRERIIESGLFNLIVGIVFVISSVVILILHFLF